MDGRKEVEVLCLLEDAIGELGGAFIVGTGKDDKPKILNQVNNFINGKKTEKNMRILSDSQVKLLAENTRANKVLARAMEVYNKREKVIKQFDAKIYACKAHNIHINSKKERANFQVSAYSRINELNIQHFEHMMIQNHSTIDEYYNIIENYMSSIETVYMEELNAMTTRFELKHGHDDILRADEIGKYIGSEESYRMRIDNKKSKVVSGVFKEYGDFLDKMDKQTALLQSKENVPSKALEYKLQYLETKTKIMEIINNGMKRIDVPGRDEKEGSFISKITKRITSNDSKGLSIDSKRRNEVCIKKMMDEIEATYSVYKDTIRSIKLRNKNDSKIVRKSQKNGQLLNEGLNLNSKVVVQNDGYRKQLEVVLDDSVNENDVIKRFVVTKLNIPGQFTSNPVVVNAMTEFLKKNIKDESVNNTISEQSIEKLKNSIQVEFSDKEVAFFQGENKMDETKKRIIIRNNTNQIFITESVESPVVIDQRISDEPVWEVNTNTRIYDGDTNIEMSRLVRRALINSSRNEIQELENSVYKRNTEDLNWVIKENDNSKRDISITPEDIATLDGAVRQSYKLCESSRNTTIRAIANKKLLENAGAVNDRDDVLRKVEEQIAKETIERKIRESKFKAGFFKYPKYSYLEQEVERA